MHKTDDLRINEIYPLISPLLLIKDYPINEPSSELITQARADAEAILRGEDKRLLCVVGPCSIHDPEAALDYAERLKAEAEKYKDELLLFMRVYFEKPRTTVGWKGLINDPHLDNSFDINSGLRVARQLLLDIANVGVPTGTEFLDVITPQYIADLVSWGAIGARTTESQIHRELASGLSMPIGFKNGTGGSIQIAVDAIGAACRPHHFLSVTKHGISAIVSTKGNDACHVILRGSSKGPNYDRDSVKDAAALLEKAGLHPGLMIDCSHGNSLKDPKRQAEVAIEIADRIQQNDEPIVALMLESFIDEGNQSTEDINNLAYGCSITDACMSWESTTVVFEKLAHAVANKR